MFAYTIVEHTIAAVCLNNWHIITAPHIAAVPRRDPT